VSGTTADALRGRVRDRYGEAARAVLDPGKGRAGCRDGSAGSCCGTEPTAVDAAACFGGPLGRAAAGFADASVTFTAEAAPGMHPAIIRAVKPGR